MLTLTANRVEKHTAEHVNRDIRRTTEANIAYYEKHPDQIEARMAELDREWDIERAVETGSSILTLTGVTLGLRANRKWFLLPIAVQLFFLQHALQGWCPPIPLLRRLGFRTSKEIEDERCTLKHLRQQ